MVNIPSMSKKKDWTEKEYDHDWHLKTTEAPEPVQPFLELSGKDAKHTLVGDL